MNRNSVVLVALLILLTWSVAQSQHPTDWPFAGPRPMPVGAIMLFDSGPCPDGWSEKANAGSYLLLTQNTNGDVNTTGGSLSYTPAGTNAAPSFTGTANQATSAVSAGTPAGSNATSTVTPGGTIAWPAGVPAFTGNAVTAASTNSGTKLVTGNTSSGVSPVTTATGTIAWPAGVPAFTGSSSTVGAQTFTGAALGTHTHTLTPAGTVSAPAFTGAAATIQPAFLKVIACKKN